MDVCINPEILRVIYFFNLILDIVKIVVPIGLIVFGLIDFSKAVMSSEEKEHKKTFNLFIKRILYGVLIFAVPWIVEVLMITLGDLIDKDKMGNFTDCLENANSECIEALESDNASTIRSTCDVPNGFGRSDKGFCWRCTTDSSIYEWGASMPPILEECKGWQKVSYSKDECPNSRK